MKRPARWLRFTLRRMLDARAWTVAELARRTGISEGGVHRLVSGSRTDPKPETLEKLAVGFGVPLTVFYEDVGLGVQIHGSVAVGLDVTIGHFAVLDAGDGHIHLEDGCKIGDGTFIYAGPCAYLKNSLTADVRVGKLAIVGPGCVLLPGAEVAPEGVVPPHTVVDKRR